jgi:diguanylate cyclase (GGDEF)-like protein
MNELSLAMLDDGDPGSEKPVMDAARIARRILHRRKMNLLVITSLGIDTSILLAYAEVGVTSMLVPFAYFAAAFAVALLFFVLSESRISDRFKDHYLTPWQVVTMSLIQLAGFIYAPQIGVLFLGILFVIFGFGALRLTIAQALFAFLLTMATFGAAMYFHPVSFGVPSATAAERAVTMTALLLVLGRCVVVGLYGSSLRAQLYQRGIQLREALARIEQLAEIDPLTGLANRRSITKHLTDEVGRAHRSKSRSSVAMLDIDWFKKINDLYGHPAGDEVLRTFGINIFANIRSIDKFGRYGGEEFLMILPETPIDAAANLLNRLRGIIRELQWKTIGPTLDVTFSAGVVEIFPGDTCDSVLARADAALYTAKLSGRNRVVIGEPNDTLEKTPAPSLVPVE